MKARWRGGGAVDAEGPKMPQVPMLRSLLVRSLVLLLSASAVTVTATEIRATESLHIGRGQIVFPLTTGSAGGSD